MRDRAACIELLAGVIVGSLLLVPGDAEAAASARYLYDLSDFSGTIPYSDVKLHVDEPGDEVEVYAALGNSIRIFNSSGMEIYSFDLDPIFGSVFDVAVDPSGDILMLTVKNIPGVRLPIWEITRCNYRGDPVGTVSITGLPAGLASFVPNLMAYRQGTFFLASGSGLQVVVADASGAYLRSHDLAALAGIPDSRRSDNDLFGFDVDPHGNILFTIATLARAFVLTPDGAVTAFGRPGSVPGSFGVVSGIAAGAHGRIVVADRLRGVVIVFDDSLEFVTEFGSGEDGRISLTSPRDVVSDVAGKVYVTQGRERGVAVFRLDMDRPAAGSSAGADPSGEEQGEGRTTKAEMKSSEGREIAPADDESGSGGPHAHGFR